MISPAMSWKNFTLREAVILGFCATFIVITRTVFRLHLHIPGHAMFFTIFFLLLGRGCVPKPGSATLVALIAGIVGALLGMGKGGPLVILKFVLPGIVIDLGGLIYPGLPSSYIACIIVGLAAASTRAISLIVVELLAGVETAIVFQHAMLTSLSNMAFGGLGALLVPPVVRRLRANRLIP